MRLPRSFSHGSSNGSWRPPLVRQPVAPPSPPRPSPVPPLRGMDACGGCLLLVVPVLGILGCAVAALIGGGL